MILIIVLIIIVAMVTSCTAAGAATYHSGPPNPQDEIDRAYHEYSSEDSW